MGVLFPAAALGQHLGKESESMADVVVVRIINDPLVYQSTQIFKDRFIVFVICLYITLFMNVSCNVPFINPLL